MLPSDVSRWIFSRFKGTHSKRLYTLSAVVWAYGLPKKRHGSGYHYNPVTLAQYALAFHGRFLRGEAPPEAFLRAAEKLRSMQDGQGACAIPSPGSIT